MLLQGFASCMAGKFHPCNPGNKPLAPAVAANMFPGCRWVSTVKEMREVFARLEAQGYPRERQEVRQGQLGRRIQLRPASGHRSY